MKHESTVLVKKQNKKDHTKLKYYEMHFKHIFMQSFFFHERIEIEL